jgi:hypothetical protein
MINWRSSLDENYAQYLPEETKAAIRSGDFARKVLCQVLELRIEMAKRDLDQIARQEGGLTSMEFAARFGDYLCALNELDDNPKFGYSTRRIADDMQRCNGCDSRGRDRGRS